jgi:putative endonuclease
MSESRKLTGDAGEAFVAGRLEREGFVILERNWRVRGGEIDIIALDGEELVFVEVRVRGGHVGDAGSSVRHHKLATLMRSARRYVDRHEDLHDRVWRVDVVAIDLRNDGVIQSYQHARNVTLE